MPQVVRTDSDNLNTQLTLTLTKEDYAPKFKSELNKYRGKASMKGFRKGKTPINLIKKMYGKSVLVDVVNEMVQKEIFAFIQEHDLRAIGQPLPSADQPELDFDVNDLKDLEFKFDIGVSPEFELKGVDKDAHFKFNKVTIEEAFLDKQVEDGRTRVGERGAITENIEENDVVKLNVEELDGDKVKENGWAASFSILVKEIADEAVQKEILTKKAGDKITVNVFNLEKDRTKDFVRKHMLEVGENDEDVEIGEMFEATITEVLRVQPAELNQEFFDKYMGPGKVTSVQEMKDAIRKDYEEHYNRQAESLAYMEFNKTLLEKNQFDLPDEFLKRWLIATEEGLNEGNIDEGYEDIAKSFRWSLIREKMVKKFDLAVSDEEVFEGIKAQVRQMFVQYGMGDADELVVLNTANKMAEDKAQMDRVYGEMMNEKIFKAVVGAISLDDEPISREDFDEILKKAREEAEAKNQAQQSLSDLVNTEEEGEGEESDEEVIEEAEEW